MRIATACLGLLCFAWTTVTFAWDGIVSGRVSQVDVTDGGNYGFRIILQNLPALCGNANQWAYVDANSTNYSAYVATLLSAKALGDIVNVYSNRDPSGYCRIGYISVSAS